MKTVVTAVVVAMTWSAGVALAAPASSAQSGDPLSRSLKRTLETSPATERVAKPLFAIGADEGGASRIPICFVSETGPPSRIAVCDAACICNMGMLLCVYSPGMECYLQDCHEGGDDICGPGVPLVETK